MKKLFALTLFLLFAISAFAADPATEALYKSKCAACHGPDGSGNTVTGKKLNVRAFQLPEVMKMSDAELLAVTSKGKEKMPAYEKKLNDAQLKQLVEYVRELSKKKI